jgi:hypothetical protein
LELQRRRLAMLTGDVPPTADVEVRRGRLSLLDDPPTPDVETARRRVSALLDGPDPLLDTRRRLNVLFADAPPPALAPPFITTVEIDGQRPSYEQVARIEAELRKIPAAILSSWRAAGGRIEIVGGRQANLHPLTAGNLQGRRIDGWCSTYRKLIAVAAEAPAATIIHEFGHAHDGTHWNSGRFSGLPEWERICRWRPATPVRFSPVEHYAEDFALFHISPETRADLPPAAREFIRESCRT